MLWKSKSNHHEYLESYTIYILPTIGGYWQRLRLNRYCFSIVALRLGAWRYCGLGDSEQSEELVSGIRYLALGIWYFMNTDQSNY